MYFEGWRGGPNTASCRTLFELQHQQTRIAMLQQQTRVEFDAAASTLNPKQTRVEFDAAASTNKSRSLCHCHLIN
jgi:hypothetical protein